MNTSIKMAGLLAAIALVTGCAAEVEVAGDTGEPVTQEDQALAPGGTRIRTGACNSDGMVIKNGIVYRLGVAVGSDVTGISNAVRSPNGPVCHNTTVWQSAANYVCNMNKGGMRDQPVAEFDEYIDGALVRHPVGDGHNGLYFAYVDMQGPCNTPSQLDFTLEKMECCKGEPTPW